MIQLLSVSIAITVVIRQVQLRGVEHYLTACGLFTKGMHVDDVWYADCCKSDRFLKPLDRMSYRWVPNSGFPASQAALSLLLGIPVRLGIVEEERMLLEGSVLTVVGMATLNGANGEVAVSTQGYGLYSQWLLFVSKA